MTPIQPGGPRSAAEAEVDRLLQRAADDAADLYWSFNARDVIDAMPTAMNSHGRSLRRLRSVRLAGTVLVAAVILAVFLVPLPHVSLFRRLVTPAKSSTPTSVPTTVPSTSTSVPVKVPPSLRKSHCSDGDVVDASSKVHFAPLRVLCIGTLSSNNGVVSNGDLYVETITSTAGSSSFRIVRISLSSYHVLRSSVFHGNHDAPILAFGALWVVTAAPDGTSQRLLKFSEGDLRLLKQIPLGEGGYDLVAFGSWFWSVAIGGGLERLDPVTGSSVAIPLPSLPPHTTVSGIAAFGSSLLLSTAGPQTADSETVVYQPGLGVTREVPAPDASVEQSDQVFAATPDVVWVIPPGMNEHSVDTFSAQTLQQLPGGFQQGGANGTWTAILSAGDLWFELGGAPLLCVSGVSGVPSASLRLPGSVEVDNLAASHAPAFVAAGNGDMVIGAWLRTAHGLVANGLAIYRLDPRCEPSRA
jgi:hypothetical protein